MSFCIDVGTPELPDLGEVCCMGVAVYGPERCTCWRPVFDVEQALPRVDLIPARRATMCGDCAFRNNSPERQGDARFQHSGEGELEELVFSTAEFACHQGMRRRLALVHPTGARVECGPGAYAPAIANGVAFKADGSPADLCAGLAAARTREAVT